MYWSGAENESAAEDVEGIKRELFIGITAGFLLGSMISGGKEYLVRKEE